MLLPFKIEVFEQELARFANFSYAATYARQLSRDCGACILTNEINGTIFNFNRGDCLSAAERTA